MYQKKIQFPFKTGTSNTVTFYYILILMLDKSLKMWSFMLRCFKISHSEAHTNTLVEITKNNSWYKKGIFGNTVSTDLYNLDFLSLKALWMSVTAHCVRTLIISLYIFKSSDFVSSKAVYMFECAFS